MTGHRDYSHRRPVTFQTPYLIATWAGNVQSKPDYDRFYRQRAAVIEQGPTPQERFEAAVARWHVEHPNG
jgi:hypothetical protein